MNKIYWPPEGINWYYSDEWAAIPPMKIRRVFAQPSRHTFLIKPVRELILQYVNNPLCWIDPCAGYHSLAGITNDLNPECPTDYHLHMLDFAKKLDGQYDGILFDPPYSLQQMKEVYNSIGIDKLRKRDAQRFYGDARYVFAPKIKDGGYAICCGWNSIGFGKRRGFEMLEVLLVCHGRAHNDTIVTVEMKRQMYFDLRDNNE